MKRVWKWFKRIVVGVFALAVLAVAAVIIILHTDWGREQVRKRVEAVLQDQFPGGARLGKLSGSIFGTLTIDDIELDGVDHKPLIKVGKLEVRPSLLPLLWKSVKVKEVIATDVLVDWRDQPSKPATSPPSTEPTSPSAWSIDLRGIEVHNGHIAVAGKPVTIDGLELGASIALPSGAPLSLTAALHGTWVERKAPIAATVSFSLEDGLPVIPSGNVTIGGVSLTASNVRGETGAIVLRGSAAEVMALEPRVELPGDLLVEITADASRRVTITGSLGPTPIEGVVQLDKHPFEARGVITTHDVDLETITRGKIRGTGGASIAFVTDGKKAAATVVATPRIEGIPLETVVVEADGTIDGGRVAVMATGQGGIRALATADVTRERVTSSHIVASLTDPSMFAPLQGAVRVSASASGAFATLAFTGTADGNDIRYQDVRIRDLSASFSGRVAKPRPYGIAHVEVHGISNAGSPFGNAVIDAKDDSGGTIALNVHADPKPNVHVDLDATAVPRGNTIGVALGTHRVNLPTMLWSGVGGRVDVLPDRIVLTDLHTSAGQGGVDLAATYRKADKDLVATATLTQIELEEMVPTITGHVDGTATIEKRGPKWSGKIDVTGTGIVAQEGLPADTELHAVLAGRDLTVQAKATNDKIGASEVDLDLYGPANPFDIAGWKRLARKDIHRVTLALHKVTPGVLDARVSGVLDGSLELTPSDSKGTFEIRGVTLPGEMGGVDVDMTVVPAPGNELGFIAQAKLSDVGTVDIGARLRLPDELFDVPSWFALGRNALRSFSAQIDEVEVTPAMLARFKVDLPYHGRAMIALAVGPGGETSKATVDLNGVLGGIIVKPVDVHVDVATTADGTSAFANASSSMKELFSVSGQSPVTTDEWIADRWAGAKQAALAGTLSIPSASAVELLAIIGRTHLTNGTIAGTATIAGKLGMPTVHANIGAHDIAVAASLGDRAPPVLEELVLDADWTGVVGSVDITGKEVGGGLMHITAKDVEPTALAAAVAQVDITQMDLVPIAAFLPGPYVSLAGRVDGNVTVHGFDQTSTKLTGKLTVAKGRIPINPTIGTLQSAEIVMKLLERTVDITLDADLGVNHSTTPNIHAEVTGDLSSLDITGRLRQVSMINAIQPIIDANVVAHLQHGAQWTGTIDVRGGHIFVPSKKGTKLLSASTPDDLVFVDKPVPIAKTFIRPPPDHPSVAVNVTLHSTLVEVEDIARTTITGKLDVSLGGGGIGLIGAIDASGSTDLFDRHYDIDHGEVTFDGTMDGLISVRLTHDFPDLTLTADVSGRVSAPQIDLSSAPSSYTRGQLLGFLLGGEPGGDTNSQTQDAAESAATSVASGLLGAKVRKVVKFVDVLRCEATSTSSSCTVGIWLDNNKLFITGKANLQARPDENRNEGEAQYYLKRNILLDLIGGDNSYHSLDILWRKHW